MYAHLAALDEMTIPQYVVIWIWAGPPANDYTTEVKGHCHTSQSKSRIEEKKNRNKLLPFNLDIGPQYVCIAVLFFVMVTNRIWI